MTLQLMILLPLLGPVLPALFVRLGRNASALAAAGVTGTILALVLSLAPRVFAGEILSFSWEWMPSLGLNASFRIDGLGMLFSLLILCMGLLVILYARYYLSARDHLGRFYAFLLLFMFAMLGLVLAGNLLFLVMFWELTSLISFLLIGYWKHRKDARHGARIALAVTGGGGLALLAGVLMLGHVVGSFELATVLESADVIQSHPWYEAVLVLILLGAFTKSAQFPFHFWLPHAMAAPTPVSAYLHSATMVKAGVFLLARLFPVLSGTDAWLFLVTGTGLVTLVLGAYTALFKHDIKGLLAYSTISHLGLITLLFGLGTPLGAVAGVFHMINHAIFKASLFMAAGIIDHEAGTRDMRRLKGLWRYMPYTATLSMVAAASMAGVPLLNGFLSKEMFFAEVLQKTSAEGWNWVVPALVTFGSMFSVAYSIRFIHDVFFGGTPTELPRTPHPPPRWIRIPVEILVGLCLLVGILPAFVVGPLLDTAASATVAGPLPEYSLAIWHGLNLPLLMSALAMVGGVLLYSQRKILFEVHALWVPKFGAKDLFDDLLAMLLGMAAQVTRTLQNGSLQRYTLLLVISALVMGAAPFVQIGGLLGSAELSPIDSKSLLTALALGVAALSATVLHRRRLVAVVLLSAVGLVVALIFVQYSAPDLALTQLAVEVVTIILLLLVLYYLPQHTPAESSRARRLRDAGVAVLAGLGSMCLVLAVLTRPFSSISDFYLQNSVPGGGGANVVNVILVDFRGFDTLGEISVLAIAALAIYAMIEGLPRRLPGADPRAGDWAHDRYPLILSITTRVLLPLALLISIYLFLRGHNQPGGGFVAGLVTSVALIMQYLASGTRWTRHRLALNFHPMIAAGVLLVLVVGLASLAFGAPFLTSAFRYFHLPVVGKFELASAMVFDLGVYLTVVGAVMLILVNLGKIRRAPARKQPQRREKVEKIWSS